MFATGQAMTEFILVGFVAVIILFVAVQFAAIGREYTALGELNYQVTRWATNPGNNTLKKANGQPQDSPQCTDVAALIRGANVSPYIYPSSAPAVAAGYMGKVAQNGVSCTSQPSGGIGISMTCTSPGGTSVTSCSGQRAAGTGVQITLTMGTSSILFLNLGSTSNPNFLGIPFPSTLSVEHTMLTQ